MKVAEYIANFVAGTTPRIYGVCGAGAMHLNDAFANHPHIEVIAMQHEQAAAMAAEAEARVTGKISAVMVTAGPGGTNAMTGVACAYVDSIPMLVIAGQVTRGTMLSGSGKQRQVGMNELDMVSMMRPITKYAATVIEPKEIRFILETAVYESTHGRKGPVFIEIPLDVQAADIDPDELWGIDQTPTPITMDAHIEAMMMFAEEKLTKAKRPLIIIGNGVRLANAVEEFRTVLGNRCIPIVSSWGGADIMPTTHPFYIGRCGIFGDRASNFVVQSADVILVIGCRLTVGQIGHASELFAPNAYKIIVDIDAGEFKKQTVKADATICMDAKEFLCKFKITAARWQKWLKHCQDLKLKYADEVRHVTTSKGIRSYDFVERLYLHLADDAVVVTDVGFCFIPTFQTLDIRSGQRLIHSHGVSPMGWGIPAAIGACSSNRQVVCLTGDGGAMMNLQELQTIAARRLKMAIFVFENDGYATMKIAQNNHFKREVMSGPSSGLTLPDFTKVAKAFDIPTMEFSSMNILAHAMETIFDIASQGPIIIVMHMNTSELISPRVQAKSVDGKFVPADISDMWPHLPREEYAARMKIKENA